MTFWLYFVRQVMRRHLVRRKPGQPVSIPSHLTDQPLPNNRYSKMGRSSPREPRRNTSPICPPLRSRYLASYPSHPPQKPLPPPLPDPSAYPNWNYFTKFVARLFAAYFPHSRNLLAEVRRKKFAVAAAPFQVSPGRIQGPGQSPKPRTLPSIPSSQHQPSPAQPLGSLSDIPLPTPYEYYIKFLPLRGAPRSYVAGSRTKCEPGRRILLPPHTQRMEGGGATRDTVL